MNSPTDNIESIAPRPAWGLWAICVLAGSAVLLMWAAGRVKPLFIYPLLAGGVIGVWARIAGAFCQLPGLRWGIFLPASCAIAVMIGGLIIASHRRAVDIKPANPLAEKLLQQFEQQTQAGSTAPLVSPFWSYLHERYHSTTAARTGTWLVAELLVALSACLVVMALIPQARTP